MYGFGHSFGYGLCCALQCSVSFGLSCILYSSSAWSILVACNSNYLAVLHHVEVMRTWVIYTVSLGCKWVWGQSQLLYLLCGLSWLPKPACGVAYELECGYVVGHALNPTTKPSVEHPSTVST